MRILLALLSVSTLFSACSSSNNVLLGRVEATVGNHKVVVTDCYRTSVPAPEKTGTSEYRWVPCKDAEVVIREDELTVNGQSYGRMNPTDSVLVDHGKVSVEKGK
jgi:hypothetical protein